MDKPFAGQVVHAQSYLLGVVEEDLRDTGLYQLTWTNGGERHMGKKKKLQYYFC